MSNSYTHNDFPAYRYPAIFSPLTAWLLSFGQPSLIPYMMVAENPFGFLLGTFFAMRILDHYGRSPWYSLFYPAFWGFLSYLFLGILQNSLSFGPGGFLYEKWAELLFLMQVLVLIIMAVHEVLKYYSPFDRSLPGLCPLNLPIKPLDLGGTLVYSRVTVGLSFFNLWD